MLKGIYVNAIIVNKANEIRWNFSHSCNVGKVKKIIVGECIKQVIHAVTAIIFMLTLLL